jgi:DNA modification methylase
LTPFGGIGSEAYMTVKLGRKATLIELKPEYFEVAVNNLKKAESMVNAKDMFSALPKEELPDCEFIDFDNLPVNP